MSWEVKFLQELIEKANKLTPEEIKELNAKASEREKRIDFPFIYNRGGRINE